MMRSTWLAMAVLVAACSSTGPQKVKTTGKAQSAELTHYRTYAQETAQEAPVGYELTSLAPEAEQEIRESVDEELAKRGYVQAPPGQADLVVRSASGWRKIEKAPTGQALIVGAPETEETQAELVIDIFDRATGDKVFHGFAREEVEPGKVKGKKISHTVSKVLEKVPTSLEAAKAPGAFEEQR